MTAISNPSVKRALPGLINGCVTLIIAWPIAHIIGFATAIDALMLWAGDGRYVVLCLWYAIVFTALAATLRGTALLFRLRVLGGNDTIDRLGQWFASRMRSAKAATTQFLQLLIGLPLSIAWEKGWKPLEDWLVDFLNRIEIERELRAEYRKNYRHIYPTFEDFKRAYYEEEKPEATGTQTSLAEAFDLLGLPETCTRAELEAQHRKLMKMFHPDVGGTNGLAAKLNQAKDLIMKQKGWK